MTDLRKGILSFDEMEVSSKMSKKEFLYKFKEIISPASGENIIYLMKLLTLDCFKFGVTFTFNDDGTLSTLKLSPYIQYKSEKWDRTGQQEERRQFCDQWLFERLGEGHKVTTNVTHYYFDNIEIYTLSHFDIREGADAGYIIIEYGH